MSKVKHIMVGGDGLSAKLFIFYLLNSIVGNRFLSGPNERLKLTQFFDSKLYPPASFVSTSHVGAMGVQRGVGALGDLLLDGLDSIDEFIEEYILSRGEKLSDWGISRGKSFQFCLAEQENEIQKLERRYRRGLTHFEKEFEKASINSKLKGVMSDKHLFFEPSLFLSKLQQKIEKLLEFVEVDYERKNFRLKSLNDLKSADFSFLALGGQDFASFFELNKEQIKLGQKRVGSVWKTQLDREFFTQLFPAHDSAQGLVLSSSFGTLTYRPLNSFENKNRFGEMMIGATSSGKSSLRNADISIAWPELIQMHEFFSETFQWPKEMSFSKGVVLSGLRHHLPKRFPFLGNPLDADRNLFCHQKLYSLGPARVVALRGLYKSGFNLAFLASKKLVKTLEEDIEI